MAVRCLEIVSDRAPKRRAQRSISSGSIRRRIKQDGQDEQDKEEMMKEECGMMNIKQHALSFILHPSAFSIAFILSILSILLIHSFVSI
jgi:hypothetical protein